MDGSYDANSGHHGVRIIYWSHNRIVDIEAFSGFTTDADCAEAIGVMRAVEWARQLQLQELKIQSDCEGVTRFLQNKSSTCDWRSKSILSEVKTFFGRDNSICHVPRPLNSEADALAKWAKQKQSCIMYN